MKTPITVTLITVLALQGCATQAYRPVIDLASDTHPETVYPDRLACEEIAKQNTTGTGEAAVGGALAGGLIGAALGAAVGAVLGVPGEGAAMGAAMFGVHEGIQNAAASEGSYAQIFANCFRG
ncbi:MAG: hypothetical protein ACHBMF_03810, partial [Chromatiales bacterium]